MKDNLSMTPVHTSMIFGTPGYEYSQSIPTSRMLMNSCAGLLNGLSYPAILGQRMQKFLSLVIRMNSYLFRNIPEISKHATIGEITIVR